MTDTRSSQCFKCASLKFLAVLKELQHDSLRHILRVLTAVERVERDPVHGVAIGPTAWANASSVNSDHLLVWFALKGLS